LATLALDVREEVARIAQSAGYAQRPAYYDETIGGRVYLAGAPPAAGPPPREATASAAARAWGEVRNTRSIAALDEFLSEFGNTPIYGALARERREELAKELSKQQFKEAAKPADVQQTAAAAPPAKPAAPAAVTPPAKPGDAGAAGQATARLPAASQVALAQPSVAAPVATAVPPPVVMPGTTGPCGTGPTTVSLPSRCGAPLTEAEERGLQPKDAFRECDKCPEMVVIPAGTFSMGAPKGEEGASRDEVPQHDVVLSRAFAAGRFAVTFDEWDACVADGGCNGYRPDDKGWGRGHRPVINISWNDAKTYTAWLSGKTGKNYRLLSEAEREYATRAGTATPFWWGSSISTEQANYNGNYTFGKNSRYGPKGEFRERTLPVDSFGPNPWGLYQVHGNVFEWTEDCKHTYSDASSDGAAWAPAGCGFRIARGGSWYSFPDYLRAAHREVRSRNDRSNDLGFRIVRKLLITSAPEQARQ
jgi:formylglycine-generating enzyme required for sulfatase activity